MWITLNYTRRRRRGNNGVTRGVPNFDPSNVILSARRTVPPPARRPARRFEDAGNQLVGFVAADDLAARKKTSTGRPKYPANPIASGDTIVRPTTV